MKPFTFQPFKTVLFAAGATMLMWTTACKKDAFDEKAALTAQRDLLQFKYDQERSLEQLRQQGATALAQLQYQFAIQQIRYQDSLSRVGNRLQDSLSRVDARRRDIIVTVTDAVTGQRVQGATVTIPTLINTVLQQTTDANGVAVFPAAGNINVPNPVQALVTRTGWGSGTSTNITGSSSTAGTATVNIWNQSNNRNTVRGNVTIETDFLNQSGEVAAGRLINLFAFVNVNGNTQRFDWSALTDNNGNYSIAVPDLPGGVQFQFSYQIFDTTARLAINGLIPGVDSIPSVRAIPARYYLGTPNAGVSLPQNPQGIPVGVPSTVSRYHAVAPADSLGRNFYFRNINIQAPVFNLQNLLSTGREIPGFVNNVSQPVNARNVDANSAFSPSFVARYTTNNNGDSLAVRFVDILNNIDNALLRQPILHMFLNPGNNNQSVIQKNPRQAYNQTSTFISITNEAGAFNTTSFLAVRRAAGQQANNNYDPTAWAIINPAMINSVNNVIQNRAFITNSSNITPFNYNPDSNVGFTSVSVTGGSTVVRNLTFGTGYLQQGVR